MTALAGKYEVLKIEEGFKAKEQIVKGIGTPQKALIDALTHFIFSTSILSFYLWIDVVVKQHQARYREVQTRLCSHP